MIFIKRKIFFLNSNVNRKMFKFYCKKYKTKIGMNALISSLRIIFIFYHSRNNKIRTNENIYEKNADNNSANI